MKIKPWLEGTRVSFLVIYVPRMIAFLIYFQVTDVATVPVGPIDSMTLFFSLLSHLILFIL